MSGNVTGQLVSIWLMWREPVERQLLPIVGPDSDTIWIRFAHHMLGDDLVRLTNSLPIRA
jgi:hypothetical protein